MILKIWRYAYGGAKVMALKSLLLSPEDYHYLLRARNLEDLVGYLRTTAYGLTLSGWDWRRGDAEAELSRRLYGDLARAFLKVRRGLKKRESRFLNLLLYRLVAENLKVVLRALNLRLDPVDAAARLLPLTALSTLDFQEMLRQETIPRLVDYLAPTIWGPPLKKGLPRFEREANLFPLEMSLDLMVYASLWQGLTGLSRADRRIAGDILGTLTDMTNITLLGELLRLQGQAATFRRRVEQALNAAYGHLVESLLSLGREGVARAALGVKPDARLVLKDRGFLGMPMPVVEFQPGDQRPHISFGGTVSAMDECQVAVREALGSIAELAEVEAILWRLAEELKRTVRRTNALNYMIIPTYQETIHYLEGALEEREREGLFHLKRVKARKAKGSSQWSGARGQ